MDSLIRHDTWRFSQGWEPIALELMDAVEAYFLLHGPEQPPRFMPGGQCEAAAYRPQVGL